MNDKSLRVLEYDKIRQMLVGYCVSPRAKQMAQQLMPSTQLSQVNIWQAQTSEAQQSLYKQSVHIGKIADIDEGIKIAIIGSILKNRQLLDIADTLRTARTLKRHITNQVDDNIALPILTSYSEQIGIFKTLEEDIERCILTEEEISDNASTTLYNIRRAIENKHAQIRNKLDRIISSDRMQKYLQDALVTIRQDRFVIPVKAEHKSHIKGLVHDQSASGATSYIEPIEIVNLNNELRELGIDERREIERILKMLTAGVAENGEAIKQTLQALVMLDFIYAKGKLSLSYKGAQPNVVESFNIRIKNGKHPLIPQDEVVPSNFYLGENFSSLLITGPNTGGKTVTLKTVGLFALMCQSGLHLPCDYGTHFPVFSRIYADIGDEQSIEQSLSTFSSHMKNIVDILEHVSERSLVLFDELGAGTDPTEGAALAMAILKYVQSKGALSVATTHYSELKHFALSQEGFENASVEFDVTTLSPTYRLLIGVPGKSNAFEISRKLGLKNHIIDSANRFLDSDSIEFEEILAAIERDKLSAEADRDTALKLKLDAEKLMARAKSSDDKIKNQRERALREAKEEARELIKVAKEEADQLVREIREMRSAANIDNRKLEGIRRDLQSKDKALRTGLNLAVDDDGDVPTQLTIGQEVAIATLGQNGTVTDLPDDKGIVGLQVGIMKMSAPLSDLRVIAGATKKKQKPKNHGESRDVSAVRVSAEVDLRGQNLDDAMLMLDKYLDDATISGLRTVTIIHGVGTGVLKKGLTDFMRRHPHVSKMRPGAFGEGGAGVTIVELK